MNPNKYKKFKLIILIVICANVVSSIPYKMLKDGEPLQGVFILTLLAIIYSAFGCCAYWCNLNKER